jgi:HlyD family secretion protein
MVQGQLEPIGDVKQIQLPIGGVVDKILVSNGQSVSKGQVLIQLDTQASSQQLSSVQSRIKDKARQVLRTEELHQEQYSSLQAQLAMDEIILKKLKDLFEAGASSELQYLQQKTAVEKLRGDLNSSKIEAKRQLAILRQEMAQLKAENALASTSVAYQSLRSPVDGVVFDLKPTSAGFVAQTSEPVLKIVPRSNLEAQVEVPSDKIGFVRVGMPVDISVDSFPASDFGVIHGEVVSIGSDALPPDQQKQQLKYNYPATIKMANQALILNDGRKLPLQVGMSLTANIKLRSVSYLQLLLSTFQNKSDSLRRI